MAANRNQPWTEDEDRRLQEMRATGRSFMSIAAALKRTMAAVEGRVALIRARDRASKKAGVESD